MSTIIDVKDLHKSYKSSTAVDGVSFQVERGEIFGFLGPNGAGKTTTVEILEGLRTADSGVVRVLELDPATQPEVLRRKIGSQLQESALPDRIKVWEALDLFGAFSANSRNTRELLEEWGLLEKRNASFGSLSGGQKQRLFIALALVNNPEIVFLDEMTTVLDPAARRTAWDLIKTIRGRGTTVILVTHFMDEAEQLCDRIAIFNRGKIAALNSPQGLINKYAPKVTISFTMEGDTAFLEKLVFVQKVSHRGKTVEVAGSILVPLVLALHNSNVALDDIHVKQPTLEDVFLAITGSHIQE